jgi:predicted Zn finger-like uncharacterized protein
MQLSCPNCETPFSVPDDALGPNGRSVQCSRCQHVWHATAAVDSDPVHSTSSTLHAPRHDHPAEVADTAAASTAEASTAETYADSQPPQTGNEPAGGDRAAENAGESVPAWDRPPPAIAYMATPTRKRGWGKVIIGLVLLLVMAASYVLRNDIAQSVPGSKRLYALAGIPLKQVGEGLAFLDLESTAAADNPALLRVSGFVQNTSDIRRPIPSVRIIVFDSQKNVLADVIRPAPALTIDPRAVLRFAYDLPAPNQTVEGLQVELTFSDQVVP